MNEAETRAEHIDPALKEAGWGVAEGSRIRREYPSPRGGSRDRASGASAEIADYVLEYRNHKLAVVEAKAWDSESPKGLAQAKNYAGKLAVRFAYSSNGQGIYGVDMRTGLEGDIRSYPDAGGALGADLWVGKRVARSLRRRPVPDKSGDVVAALLPGDRSQPGAGPHRRWEGPGRC